MTTGNVAALFVLRIIMALVSGFAVALCGGPPWAVAAVVLIIFASGL